MDRFAHTFWMIAPFWLCNTKLGLWLLPFAGRHEYSRTGQGGGE